MLTLFTAVALAAAPQAGVEIRFCPEKRVHPYAFDSLRGVQGLLLHNVVIVNRGAAPVAIDRIVINLRSGERTIETRQLDQTAIAAVAAGGKAAEAQGALKLFKFQFCDGRLLDRAALADGSTLGPGQALLITHQPFVFQGRRSDIQVEVWQGAGGSAVQRATLPIDPGTSKTRFSWPLPGPSTWVAAAASSLHTAHRWAVPEEFGLDILKIDATGSTYRGAGNSNAEFHAYGANVLAAADGRVVKLITGASEDPPMLRKAGESMQDYYGRIGTRQARNIAAGDVGLFGEGIVLDHGNGEYSLYAHLIPGSALVKLGDQVKRRQPIARLGSSGNSTEAHLHFHVCDGPDGIACAGIPPTFIDIDLPLADGARPIQSGDLVRVIE
jgi:murein DD-endopeptidase MepM/ murein hydrolase activator NlpD